ncbi:hypothetical protein MBLNU13_g04237t1 [Cladosporium sp. NU13]
MAGIAMTNQDGKSFFELVPAEIRDQIYDATMFQTIQRQKVNFQFKAPCPHLRFVSRQFKDEYDARSHFEIYLVWDSVRMLKDYASQRPTGFLYHLNYLIEHPGYDVREDISDSGIAVALKLRYGGIPLLNTSVRSKCDVLGAELLKEPVTLGVWSAEDDCFLLDEDVTSERLKLETVVEVAIQAETVKDQVSNDGEVDIFEDQIWQGRDEG